MKHLANCSLQNYLGGQVSQKYIFLTYKEHRQGVERSDCTKEADVVEIEGTVNEKTKFEQLWDSQKYQNKEGIEDSYEKEPTGQICQTIDSKDGHSLSQPLLFLFKDGTVVHQEGDHNRDKEPNVTIFGSSVEVIEESICSLWDILNRVVVHYSWGVCIVCVVENPVSNGILKLLGSFEGVHIDFERLIKVSQEILTNQGRIVQYPVCVGGLHSAAVVGVTLEFNTTKVRR